MIWLNYCVLNFLSDISTIALAIASKVLHNREKASNFYACHSLEVIGA
ncbi:hypothetical protein [Okeania sp. KiyG1]|nr:hypothetical protein [Okeania sp. KiyG1]